MTRQEYYDLLVKTSRDGGFPAIEVVGPGPACRYRCRDGRRCAVGVLIPDDRYPGETGTADNLPAELLSDILPAGMRLPDLMDVQNVHDQLAHIGVDSGVGWGHDAFVRWLNGLPCFESVTRLEA